MVFSWFLELLSPDESGSSAALTSALIGALIDMVGTGRGAGGRAAGAAGALVCPQQLFCAPASDPRRDPLGCR